MTYLRTILVLVFLATSALGQDTSGQFGTLAEDSDKPIEAQADKMEVDESTGLIEMSGNVEIIQGSTTLSADFVRIEYNDEQTDIETVFANGSVYLKSAEDTAQSDEAIYKLTQNMIYLNGNAVLRQGDNSLNAASIELNTDTGVSVMTGRVSTTLLPRGN